MVKQILGFIGRFFILFIVISVLWVLALKFLPVYVTPLMLKRGVENVMEGKKVEMDKHWVPMNEISKQMVYAVVASEDNLFIQHHGFSVKAIQRAIEDNKKGKRVRGGSTISQQTAKNVFTFGTRTWLRKGIESYYTLLIELMWSKERIMEVYLNIAELGNGIYGVEAASQAYFDKPAIKLSKAEAALLAAALPSPRVYSVKNPGPYMRRRQLQIMNLMPKMARIDFVEPKKK